jgi:serine/threonine-protein kinase
MSFETGAIVGDYQIIGLLGRGGMGKVFKVRNLISDRVEAMKVLLPHVGAMQDLAERFIREIKVVASLDHPNIAQLRTAVRSEDRLLMIMEFVEGSSLDEAMRRGPIDLGLTIDYTCQVLNALAYAHGRGVVHRDIKPSNILVTTCSVVKLTDFGIASRLGDPRLTAAGVALGSIAYMSPEQVRSSVMDGRSDLYSVGVTLYEMVTGRHPFQADSDFAILQAHLEQIPLAPIELMPHLPPALSQIVQRSLEKNPGDRFQTAEEFRNALLTVGSCAVPRLVSTQPLNSDQTTPTVPSTPAVPATPIPAQPSASMTSSPAEPQAGKSWDPALIERIRKELATYIGPMAKVIVGRTAKKAQSVDELYKLIATEIPSDDDRRKFLATRPLRLSRPSDSPQRGSR